MDQKVFKSNGQYDMLDAWFEENHVKVVMLVCDRSIVKHRINEYFDGVEVRLGVKVVRFMNFQPNPLYENVVAGVKIFRTDCCDGIIAVGGGSAMDVAKCIKLYSDVQGDGVNGVWLKTAVDSNSIPFLAMPTTSGTGSEATKFAVIYYEGVKQSIVDNSCIPGTVLMDANIIKTVPEYQRKATMMDALCHAIESYWSVNSTDESKEYSKVAIQGVMQYMDAYLRNCDEGNAGMLMAANSAGKAINITQTTAGHAMCYKITSMFGCAHGHAVALCDRVLFLWMIDHVDRCCDIRGTKYVENVLDEIGKAMGCEDAVAGASKLNDIFETLALDVPVASVYQFEVLKNSVNPVRLKNHPVALDVSTIDELYHKILNGGKR